MVLPGPRGPAESRFPRVATRTASDLASVAAARGFARSTLQRWGLAGRCDDVTVVVSELLSNALRHARPRPGGCPVRFGLLELWPSSAVLCAVTDPSAKAPVPGTVDHLAESGRGLHVVRELSDRWGYAPARGCKVVWAVFGETGSLAVNAGAAHLAASRYPGTPGRHRAPGAPDTTGSWRAEAALA